MARPVRWTASTPRPALPPGSALQPPGPSTRRWPTARRSTGMPAEGRHLVVSRYDRDSPAPVRRRRQQRDDAATVTIDTWISRARFKPVLGTDAKGQVRSRRRHDRHRPALTVSVRGPTNKPRRRQGGRPTSTLRDRAGPPCPADAEVGATSRATVRADDLLSPRRREGLAHHRDRRQRPLRVFHDVSGIPGWARFWSTAPSRATGPVGLPPVDPGRSSARPGRRRRVER